MKDILPQIQEWNQAGKTFAIATVVDTWRSAPRMPGSAMIISEQHEIVGSVSGGCIEGAVIQQAQETMASGKAQLMTFGVSNEDAWRVGLSCGGKIKVFVEPFLLPRGDDKGKAIWSTLTSKFETNEGVVLVTKLDSSADKGLFTPEGPSHGINSSLQDAAHASLKKRSSALVEVNDDLYFLQAFPEKNHLIIIGAAHLSVDLVDLAHSLDFSTTVIDPRGVFTDSLKNLTAPSSLLQSWPEEALAELDLNENTYAVTLSHDPKIDDPALDILLRSKVKYIGALGSRKTHQRRISRLAQRGFSEADIARIHAPVGLSIGALTPREIALSIAAQLIKIRRTEVG